MLTARAPPDLLENLSKKPRVMRAVVTCTDAQRRRAIQQAV
jgi:hypothetical protein